MLTAPLRIRVGLGLAGGLCIAGLIVVILAYGQGHFARGYELRAVFPTSSQGLFTDGASAVKLRGMNVGTVSGISLLPDGRAELRFFIDDDVRIPDTTTAYIEPLSVFGPKFVRLEPGEHEAAGPYLHDGDEILRTSTQRELADILASATELFETVDPMDLIVTVDAIADSVAGLGPQLGRTIDATGVLAEVAARHDDELRRFLGDVSRLSDTFARHADDILGITQHLGPVVRPLVDQPDQLDALLDVTVDISRTFSRLLLDNEAELSVTLESVGSFIAEVDAEADEIPEFLDMVGTFFGRLSDVIRFDAPAGLQMAALRGFISLDLCLVYGICPGAASASSAGPVGTSAAGPASVTGSQVADARALQAVQDAQRPAGPLVDLVDHLLAPREPSR